MPRRQEPWHLQRRPDHRRRLPRLRPPYCSTAGGQPAHCASAFCVGSPRSQSTNICFLDGKRYHCDAAGGVVEPLRGRQPVQHLPDVHCRPTSAAPSGKGTKICLDDRVIGKCIEGTTTNPTSCAELDSYCSAALAASPAASTPPASPAPPRPPPTRPSAPWTASSPTARPMARSTSPLAPTAPPALAAPARPPTPRAAPASKARRASPAWPARAAPGQRGRQQHRRGHLRDHRQGWRLRQDRRHQQRAARRPRCFPSAKNPRAADAAPRPAPPRASGPRWRWPRWG